jgi:hypothetical protein
MKNIEKIIAFVGGAKVVFIIPLPRYVLAGCCTNTDHVTNRLSGELAAEFAGAEKCLLEAAAIGGARMINLLSFFGSGESSPQDLTTVDGTSVWAGDGVHLTSNASRVASRSLMVELANGGEEDGPVNKRARLKSVVPTPAPAKKKSAAKGQPPTSPPAPLWLSGQLTAPQRGRGSGRGSGPSRGAANQGPRGGGPIRGGTRGANAGQWGPPRGGQYGRWGRW